MLQSNELIYFENNFKTIIKWRSHGNQGSHHCTNQMICNKENQLNKKMEGKTFLKIH